MERPHYNPLEDLDSNALADVLGVPTEEGLPNSGMLAATAFGPVPRERYISLRSSIAANS